MESTRLYSQLQVNPEVISILMEISHVSKRLANNLAKLAQQQNDEGGNVHEQNGRIEYCGCGTAQMRRNPYRNL